MKAVPMFEDNNGNLHRTEGEALRADARIVFEDAVTRTTYQGEFSTADFLVELRANPELRGALQALAASPISKSDESSDDLDAAEVMRRGMDVRNS